MRPRWIGLAACVALSWATVSAQPVPPVAAASPELARACSELPASAQDSRALAMRSQCVLAGALPSERRYTQSRELARRSLGMGDPAGGFMLYVAFTSDPANGYLRDGKPDLEAYRRLGARPVAERGEQVEALEALAFATSKGHVNAALALAVHLSETVAPRNVERVRGLVALLLGSGERHPVLQRLGHQAQQVLQFGPTKASLRTFADAYGSAVGAATMAFMVRNGGSTCERFTPKVVESGEIEGAEYLPLKHRSLENTYLLRGKWVETWSLSGCGQDIAVTMTFAADGWGGAHFTAQVQPNP